jgi:hypothetical protein
VVLIVGLRRCGLGAADQAAGQCVGGDAVVVGLLAGDDRVAPAGRSLEQAPSVGREVVDDLGFVEAQVVEVDHVEVGPIARCDDTTIEQADRAGGVATVALHEERQRDPVVVAVASPVGEQRRREAAVADRADVRAAVGQSGHRVRVGQHLVAAVEVAVDVVEERQVEQPVSVVGEHRVECNLLGTVPGAGGDRLDRGVERRLVIGFVAHLEQQVEAADQVAAELLP